MFPTSRSTCPGVRPHRREALINTVTIPTASSSFTMQLSTRARYAECWNTGTPNRSAATPPMDHEQHHVRYPNVADDAPQQTAGEEIRQDVMELPEGPIRVGGAQGNHKSSSSRSCITWLCSWPRRII